MQIVKRVEFHMDVDAKLHIMNRWIGLTAENAEELKKLDYPLHFNKQMDRPHLEEALNLIKFLAH